MRTRINKYTIIGERQIKLETPITIEDVRLIINETKKIVIASSMQKDNITINGGIITYTDALPISEVGDYFTIEIDKGETIKDILGDANVLLSDVSDGKAKIADAINTKGGEASAESSFSQLAEDIQTLPYTGISAEGIVQTEEFNFLKYVTSGLNNEIVSINDSTITKITKTNAFFHNIALREVIMNGVTTISGNSTFQTCSSLQSVNLPNLTTISGSSTFLSCSSLQSVNLPNLATISSSSTFYNCSSLNSVIFGTLLSIAESFYNAKQNLRNITIGAGTDVNLPFQYWTATNVIAEGQSGIDELNSNLRTNLLEKLADHSEDGQTRTLRLGWLAHVSQENIDYANSKGWTLTT